MKLFCVFMNSICMDESRYTRHVRVISRYPISIDFQRLTGCRRDPRVLGCHRLRERRTYRSSWADEIEAEIKRILRREKIEALKEQSPNG